MSAAPIAAVGAARLYLGDCREVLATLPAESVDAVVTDPPYELGFMGKAWDATGVAFDPETWRAVLRVMKPGAHLLAFGGTRTYHRMVCAIEDAGFEIRDQMQWIYGSGFPKSLNVRKAVLQHLGADEDELVIDGVEVGPFEEYDPHAKRNRRLAAVAAGQTTLQMEAA